MLYKANINDADYAWAAVLQMSPSSRLKGQKYSVTFSLCVKGHHICQGQERCPCCNLQSTLRLFSVSGEEVAARGKQESGEAHPLCLAAHSF